MKLAYAETVAAQLVEWLRPFCERIEVAGSLRRQCPTVNDIELVAIPRLDNLGADLFGQDTGPVNTLKRQLDRMRATGQLSERLDARGGRAWGERFVRAIYHGGPSAPGQAGRDVALDVFMVLPPAQWGLILLIRTGDSEFAKQALTRWHEVSGGHSENGRLLTSLGAPRPTPEEADVFQALGWSYVAPQDRSIRARPAAKHQAELPVAPPRAAAAPAESVFHKCQWDGPMVTVGENEIRASCSICGRVYEGAL